MDIKMIVTDLDGTLLDDDKKYNIKLFNRIFEELERRNILFVVATGNQAPFVKKEFPNCFQRMGIVAANGANITYKDSSIYQAIIQSEVVKIALDEIQKIPFSNLILDGTESSYVSSDISDLEMNQILRYSPSVVPVKSLYDIHDDIFKITFKVAKDKSHGVKKILDLKLKDKLVTAESGYGDIDLVLPNVSKSSGLQKLSNFLNFNMTNVVSFGDNDNDYEMIRDSGRSYAMANGNTRIRKIANSVIGDNNSDAVLRTIEKILSEDIEVRDSKN